MRVKQRVGGDERGAVLPIAAAFVIVAVIFLAFAIDIGDLRQDRRQLTTATDAAAFDVAQTWSDSSLDGDALGWSRTGNTWDCDSAAQTYLDKNRTDATGAYECTAELINEQLGSVHVYSAGTVDYEIAPAIGAESGQVRSTSSVKIQSTTGGGLRPWTVCARDADVLAWFNAGGPGPVEITLGGDKFLPEECGQNNANWGFFQFETQASGQKSLSEIIREGSDDPTAAFDNGANGNPLDPYADEKAVCVDDAEETPQTLYDEQDPVTCVFNSTGAAGWNNNNALQAFDYLRDNQIVFSVPLYGEVQPIGGGQQTGFPIIGFAEVQLVSYNEAQGANENEMTLRFLSLSVGDCCDVNESNQDLALCDVGDLAGNVAPTFATACQTSAATSGGPGNTVPEGSQPCEVSGAVLVTPGPFSRTDPNPPADHSISQAADFDISVVDSSDCGDLSGLLRNETKPNQTNPLTSPMVVDSTTMRVTAMAGSGNYNHGNGGVSDTWNLELSTSLEAPVTYAPVAQITVG